MAKVASEGLPYQDTTYSWFVLAACAGLELLYASGVATIGVLIVHLTETFNTNKSALTWIGGLLLFFGFILGFIPSTLAKKYGCRPVGIVASLVACGSFLISAFAENVDILYFSHGILASISLCTFFNLASISGQQYFHRHRSLAAGVTMASISAGILIWPPACQLLIDTYGWRGAFVIIAGIQLHGLVFSALIRPVTKEKPSVSATEIKELAVSEVLENVEKTKHADEQCMNDDTKHRQNDALTTSVVTNQGIQSCCETIKEVFRSISKPLRTTPHYLLYLIGIFLIQTGHITALSMLPSLSRNLGINKTLGAMLLSILGGVGGVSRALSGFIGDLKMVNRSLVVGASGLLSGLVTSGMGYLTSYPMLAGFAGILGATSGAYSALQGACVIDYVGRHQLASGVGLLSIAMGFGRLSALLAAGAVLDLVGDPRYVFMLFGLMEAVGGLLLPVVFLVQRHRQKYEQSQNHD